MLVLLKVTCLKLWIKHTSNRCRVVYYKVATIKPQEINCIYGVWDILKKKPENFNKIIRKPSTLNKKHLKI